MYKFFLKVFTTFIILFTLVVIYLTFFGLKTDKFNQIINNKILSFNKKISISLNDVIIKLIPTKLQFEVSTKNPKITFNNNIVNLKTLKTNLPLINFFTGEIILKELTVSSYDNKINNLIKLARIYKNNLQLTLLNKFIQNGELNFTAALNFDDEGKIKSDYIINGEIKSLDINYLSNNNLQNISFEFITDSISHKIKNLSFNSNKIDFYSKNISIKINDNKYEINGDVNNTKQKIKKAKINKFFDKLDNVVDDSLFFSSISNFNLLLSKKYKILNFSSKSEIRINEIGYKIDNKYLKNSLGIKNNINFLDQIVTINLNGNSFKKNKLKMEISGLGKISVNGKIDKIKYNLKNDKNKKIINFETLLNNNFVNLKILNYYKPSKSESKFKIEDAILYNNKLNIKKILFAHENDKFEIKNLNFNNFKEIQDLEYLYIYYKNKNERISDLKIIKENLKFKVISDVFYGKQIIDSITENKTKNKLISNKIRNISIDIKKLFLDKKNFINNFSGKIKYNYSSIYSLDLRGKFPNQKQIIISIKKDIDNNQITNIYTKYPKPLVKRYKFIKGFEEGVLDYQSIKKNNKSSSILIIDNFKVKEVPVLAKILTLASLQGIADLLTGEGIRFTDFEMKYSNESQIMNIEEIYAIGPAISLMMSGYIEKNKLISLRGTLVPATTINRTISSIPILGNILVGKKVGEGVFGVSFKIKGSPDDLKTTVNPIKTLTPRFITRTLEKIKKN